MGCDVEHRGVRCCRHRHHLHGGQRRRQPGRLPMAHPRDRVYVDLRRGGRDQVAGPRRLGLLLRAGLRVELLRPGDYDDQRGGGRHELCREVQQRGPGARGHGGRARRRIAPGIAHNPRRAHGQARVQSDVEGLGQHARRLHHRHALAVLGVDLLLARPLHDRADFPLHVRALPGPGLALAVRLPRRYGRFRRPSVQDLVHVRRGVLPLRAASHVHDLPLHAR
mmetsp:Transcript_67832/g.196435  ORF Transcript_67832/g.196435 Transcript_67832/m.196435 type:complete len:223 (-) Transcript_67832:667-1335(-)